jgi:beta-barrel assembly-enhancing protease
VTSAFAGTMVVSTLLLAAPASAQLRDILRGAGQVGDVIGGFRIGPKEEAEIGAQISEHLRKRFGVMQDEALHRYVTLVGRSVAAGIQRTDITWTFIVLDTDGVNAFAAPGGFVHITRGALALIDSEAELAGVLAHEIGHIEQKHALAELRRSRAVDVGRRTSRTEAISRFSEAGLRIVSGNLWDQKQELESDRFALELTNAAGYSPAGLGEFLNRLLERNEGIRDEQPTGRTLLRNGLFSSHPEMQERVAGIEQAVASSRLTASATVQPRYEEHVDITALSLEELAIAMAGGAQWSGDGGGIAGGLGALSQGLDALQNPVDTFASRQEAGVAYARNLDVDSDAPGGPNPATVAVTVSPAELEAFRRGITAV